MDLSADVVVIKQHLIDPEICIRCNTCESVCPTGAITHDDRNYVVRRRRVQPVHGVHLAMPHRLDRQLAHDAQGARVSDRRAAHVGRAAGRADLGAARGRRRRRRREAPASRAGACRGARRGRRRSALQFSRLRRGRAAVVGRATLHQPLRAEERHDRDGGRQLQLHRGGLRKPDASHRARLRHDAVPGARRAIDRHRAARCRCERAPPCRAAVFGREPAQWRATRLQQRFADGQARAARPSRQAGARRRRRTTCAI